MPKHIKIAVLLVCILLMNEKNNAGQWLTIDPMPTARAGASVAVWGGKLYVFGGKSNDNRVLNTVDCYNLSTHQWNSSNIPNFNHERYNAAAVVYHDRIFLIGGRGYNEVMKMVEVYDPVQNVWSVAHSLHEKREGHSAVVLQDRIYVIGGQEEESSLVDEIEWYDEGQNNWKKVDGETPFERVASFSAAVDDTVYMFGGYYYGLTKTLFKGWFNDQGSQWLQDGELQEARAYGATVRSGDSLYLIGGETASGKSGKVEIYNLLTGEISDGLPLPTPRSGMAGSCAGDSIFVLGGYSQYTDKPLNLAEVYLGGATAIGDVRGQLPQEQVLVTGYPNPFNGQIRLQLILGRAGTYQMDIYNIHGQRVKHIFNGRLSAGTHGFRWQAKGNNGSPVPSGVYFLSIKSRQQMTSCKIVYVK